MGPNIIQCVDREFSALTDQPSLAKGINRRRHRKYNRSRHQEASDDRKWKVSFCTDSNCEFDVRNSISTEMSIVSDSMKGSIQMPPIRRFYDSTTGLGSGLSSQIEPEDMWQSNIIDYEGDVLDDISNKPHGYGCVKFENGYIYRG